MTREEIGGLCIYPIFSESIGHFALLVLVPKWSWKTHRINLKASIQYLNLSKFFYNCHGKKSLSQSSSMIHRFAQAWQSYLNFKFIRDILPKLRRQWSWGTLRWLERYGALSVNSKVKNLNMNSVFLFLKNRSSRRRLRQQQQIFTQPLASYLYKTRRIRQKYDHEIVIHKAVN